MPKKPTITVPLGALASKDWRAALVLAVARPLVGWGVAQLAKRSHHRQRLEMRHRQLAEAIKAAAKS